MNISPIYIEAGISGFESPAAQYIEESLSLDQLLIRNPNATFIGRANGNSMVDVNIESGDIIVVDRSIKEVHGDVIVANFNGCFVCKILDIRNHSLVSASINVPPVIIQECDTFQVEGVVTTIIKELRRGCYV